MSLRTFSTVARDFPASTGGYKAIYTYYDIMSRAVEQTNPTEVNSSWVPAGDDSAGFLSATQTYDWKGRPLVTTNQDDTTKTVTYSGCGCAGGEVVTILDEVSRKQKFYSDVFGRSIKTEVYSNSTTVNSTVVTTYNLLDQATQLRQYSGTDSSTTYQDTTFQYDGYGRPWKTHKPEFAANTYNTITYNADDTQATVTDPRSVVNTFSYNDRRLVTGISYSTVSGIETTPSVTLTYDAGGNRLSTSSSVAEVDYVYDTAARMTSETQTVTGVTGEFTLNYTYKPSGVLASVEDPFDRVVSYSYDKTGQLTSVSGTNYPNVTNFISGIQYRAWGRAKSIAYGNGVDENTEFNERLQPTEYELADLRLFDNSTYTDQSTVDYYDDGRLFHSFYATGLTKFDRKFEYDFAGRIKEAYTGREAHDQSPLTPRDNPFRQSFQYDAFGNMTQRSGFLWRHTVPTDADTFTNNQRTEWSYDATGNVVYTESGGGAFDSAGQKTHATSSQTDDLGSGNYRMFDSNISHGLDSEGWFRSRTEYRYVEQSIGEDFDYTEDTTTQYFLWSTVLGAIVAELDNDGDQTTGFIFAGQRIASLEITPSSSAVYFRNVDSQTGTTYRTDYTGKGGRDEEFDPLGAQIPKTDPYITQNRLYTDLKPAGRLFMNDASPFSYDNSCSLDGIPTPCGIAQRLGASGAADVLVEADVYIRYTSGRIDRYSGKVTAALAGINQVWKGADARAAAAGFFSALHGGLETAINAAFNNVYISRNDRVPENNGVPNGAVGLRNYAHASPQNPVPAGELERIGADIEKAIAAKQCADFLKALLDETATLTGQPYRDIRVTFDNIKFSYGDTGAYGGLAKGSFENGTASAVIRPFESNFISADRSAFIRTQTAQNFLGETLHHVGTNSAYTDGAFANALNNILVRQGRDKFQRFPGRTEAEVQTASIYWHPKVFDACKMKY